MTAATTAARAWLNNEERPEGSRLQIVDVRSGMALGRRTGVVHYVADAAEITVDGDTTLAARWICGGSTIDAEVVPEGEEIACVGCRITAAVPSGPVVYFAWGADGDLLYVGSSINVAQRIKNHLTATDWWGDVRRLTFESHETEGAARRAELDHIGRRPGVHNREGRRRTPATVSFLDHVEVVPADTA